ncbi:MAG: alpha-ribazole phosphatase family protein [Gammaproteobacteria bacterium]|nr:alpha-ribazole phosphatase family protein [Gammaproteobacteria bacterium]
MPSHKNLTTIIDLLRHGEPVGGPRYRGHRDDPLTTRGWQQMSNAVEQLDGQDSAWSHIISSPLQRCHDFAQQLARRRAITLEREPQLREIHFGQWEGKTSAQILRKDPDTLPRYWENPQAVTPPGGEPLARFQRRVADAWGRLLHRHAGKHVLLVTHGGVMRVLLNDVLNVPQQAMFGINIPYACLSRLCVDHTARGNRTTWRFHRVAD